MDSWLGAPNRWGERLRFTWTTIRGSYRDLSPTQVHYTKVFARSQADIVIHDENCLTMSRCYGIVIFR